MMCLEASDRGKVETREGHEAGDGWVGWLL